MEENSLCPRIFESLELAFILKAIREELANGKNHRNEGKQIAKRHHRWRMGSIRFVLLCGRVTKPDLVLIIQPVPIMRAQRHINDPLNEAALDPRLVLVIGSAIR